MYCIDCVFFFKQKTAYEMRISDWSSDVCSSDLIVDGAAGIAAETLDLRDVAAQPFPCDLPYGAEPVGQPRRHRAGERRQVRHRNPDVEKLDAAGRLTASAEMAVRQAAITYTGAFKPHKALANIGLWPGLRRGRAPASTAREQNEQDKAPPPRPEEH